MGRRRASPRLHARANLVRRRAQCEAQGGVLAVPASDDEQWALLGAALGAAWDDWWIGATDQWSEGSFTDAQGAPLGYWAWDEGLPDGAESENCVVLDLARSGL